MTDERNARENDGNFDAKDMQSRPSLPSDEHASSGRDAGNGRFTAGNTARLVHGQRSGLVARGLLLPPGAPLPHEREAALVADLGEVSTIQRGLVRRLVHAELIAEWLEGNLIAEGVMTTKGRARASVNTYLSVVDRLARLASVLGLERRPRHVGTIDAVRDAVERVNR